MLSSARGSWGSCGRSRSHASQTTPLLSDPTPRTGDSHPDHPPKETLPRKVSTTGLAAGGLSLLSGEDRDLVGRGLSPWSGGVMVIIWAVNSSSKYLVSVSDVTWGLKGGMSCRAGVRGLRAGSAVPCAPLWGVSARFLLLHLQAVHAITLPQSSGKETSRGGQRPGCFSQLCRTPTPRQERMKRLFFSFPVNWQGIKRAHGTRGTGGSLLPQEVAFTFLPDQTVPPSGRVNS